MTYALSLARAQLGQTWPNPAVGAVVVKNNQILSLGATQRSGRPHAETVALAKAGDAARGATLYVTLEPCAHHGQTPPCVEAIIASKIASVVVACRDPHRLASGGIAALKTAGISVIEGVCEAEARDINRGFFSVVEHGRPYIAMKIATSADEKIALRKGERTAITGAEAQHYVQELRSQFDAILTGIGTVLADNPLLTVRISGLEHRSPVRVVLDSQGRMPRESQLMQTAMDVPVWVMKGELPDIIKALADKGITRLLIEAGQAVNTAFLQAGLVDRLYWLSSSQLLGDNALSAVKNFSVSAVVKDWQRVGDVITLGADHLTIFEK